MFHLRKYVYTFPRNFKVTNEKSKSLAQVIESRLFYAKAFICVWSHGKEYLIISIHAFPRNKNIATENSKSSTEVILKKVHYYTCKSFYIFAGPIN